MPKSQDKTTAENGADGIGDIEGKAATGSGERVGKRASFNQAKKARHGRQRREGSGRALREAVEEKFDRGEDVLDYFDVSKARVIRPQSKSITKTKVGWPPKRNSERRAIVRENRGKGFPR